MTTTITPPPDAVPIATTAADLRIGDWFPADIGNRTILAQILEVIDAGEAIAVHIAVPSDGGGFTVDAVELKPWQPVSGVLRPAAQAGHEPMTIRFELTELVEVTTTAAQIRVALGLTDYDHVGTAILASYPDAVDLLADVARTEDAVLVNRWLADIAVTAATGPDDDPH
ncbi:MAG: hypothetical protein HOV79_15650 [Hamadaea sp.]|nr:hypothetical protein [Hamadaea sp.]